MRFLPLLWIAVAGCDGCDGDHTAAPAPSVSATATATAVPESGPRLLVAAHPGGKVLFRITVEGERLRVDGDETLEGMMHQGARRYRRGDEVVVKVDLRGDAFRVQDGAARPIYSVRHEPEAIWIEGEGGPYVVQRVDAGLAVFARGKQIGRVAREGDRILGRRGDETIFEVRGDALSPALGVALLEAIPTTPRHAIMAELFAEKR